MTRKPPAPRRKAKRKQRSSVPSAKSAVPVVIPRKQDAVLVTTNAQVGGVLGVEGRSVRTMKNAPWWPVSGLGPYDLTIIGPAYRAEMVARSAGKLAAAKEFHDEDGVLLDPEKEKARFRRYKADLEKLKLSIQRGEYLPRGRIDATFNAFFTAVKTLHDAVGRNRPDIRKELSKGMNRAKQDFVKAFSQAGS